MRGGTILSATERLLKVIIAGLVCLAGATGACGAQYTMQDYKIQAPRITLTIGEKMTASEGATLTTKDLTLHADTVTCFFDAESRRIQRLQATGHVRFRAKQKREDGSLMEVDGEGDSLVYEIAEGKVTIHGARSAGPDKKARKAHAHAVETIPPKPPANGQPAAQPTTRTYDIHAFTINLDLKRSTLEASGEVEIDASLPETPSKQSPAK
ncbi:MAG: hypothetical protein GTO55_02540 [Armatimonadetes bacterium]|nr:hypothetical protein [Armatimonadota bacterium]NIM23157.1 hypothetical protein [Armatimonadota bacterium]NIM67025.1 hypothetical protein [Armatimonadota bacterium]NIM75559.1 hypothetical protein [Armatimonadota bacterium]NIN05214.1 hypothetical protein [Armatimonadota bacterium]